MENLSKLKIISAYFYAVFLHSCYTRLPGKYLIPIVSPCTCFYITQNFCNTAIYFVHLPIPNSFLYYMCKRGIGLKCILPVFSLIIR